MKKLNYIKTALVALTVMATFSSCLKQPVQYDFTKDAPVVDFAFVAGTGVSLYTATVSTATTPTSSVNALVTIGAQHDYTSAIPVTIIIDAASMTAKYGTTYTVLPASVYTVSSLTTNIIPGIQQRIEAAQSLVGTPAALPSISLGLVSFVVNTAAFNALKTANPTVTYMLPLTITSAPGAVIDQFSTMYIVVK